MRAKRLFWLALLLPQFGVLLLLVFEDLRELRHELQFHAPRSMGCTALPFNVLEFGGALLGLAGVIGLCGLRPWSRFVYAVFAVGLFSATLPDLLRASSGIDSFALAHIAVLVTLALCFVRRLSFF